MSEDFTEARDVILPDWQQWSQKIVQMNYTYQRSQEEANNIAEALEQAFLQGKALGYRQGWANGHREGFNVAYKDLTGAQ